MHIFFAGQTFNNAQGLLNEPFTGLKLAKKEVRKIYKEPILNLTFIFIGLRFDSDKFVLKPRHVKKLCKGSAFFA